MNAYKNVSFVGFVIFFFGIVITFYGFTFYQTQNNLVANGIKVKGTVFDINENAIYRSPFIKFKTLDGQEMQFLSQLEVNQDLFNYTIGQEVDVIYNKDNPTEAKIDAFMEGNFEQLFLAIFGVFLMLLGLFIRRHFLKKAQLMR